MGTALLALRLTLPPSLVLGPTLPFLLDPPSSSSLAHTSPSLPPLLPAFSPLPSLPLSNATPGPPLPPSLPLSWVDLILDLKEFDVVLGVGPVAGLLPRLHRQIMPDPGSSAFRAWLGDAGS